MLLGAAALVAFALLLALGSNVAFFIDDWNVLLGRTGSFADTYLDPYNGHPSMSLVGTYRLLQTTVGMDSIVPFFVVSLLAFVASGLILFLWMRSRVGDWLALAASISILFLGSASEDLLITFQLGYFVPAACGIGCFLALERETRAGDIAACGLLLVALTFSGLGLPFLVGAAVAIALGARPLARLWVVAVPAALFALWSCGRRPRRLGRRAGLGEPGRRSRLRPRRDRGLDLRAARADRSPRGGGALAARLGTAAAGRGRDRRRGPGPLAATAVSAAGSGRCWRPCSPTGCRSRSTRVSSASRSSPATSTPAASCWSCSPRSCFGASVPSRPVLIGAFALLAVTVAGNLAALRADYLDRRLQAEAHGGAFAALDIAADSR